MGANVFGMCLVEGKHLVTSTQRSTQKQTVLFAAFTIYYMFWSVLFGVREMFNNCPNGKTAQ